MIEMYLNGIVFFLGIVLVISGFNSGKYKELELPVFIALVVQAIFWPLTLVFLVGFVIGLIARRFKK